LAALYAVVLAKVMVIMVMIVTDIRFAAILRGVIF
jgi:hypothetical protein